MTSISDRLLYDPKYFLESLVEIVNKDRVRVPFIFNPVQNRYYRERTSRDIILKPRQLGFSTEIMGLFLHDTMFFPNTISITVAHTEKDAVDLFERVHFMFNSVPEELRPSLGRGNVRELRFDRINSKYTVGSAEAKHFGISKTISNLHLTEVSHPYYKEEFIASLLESVPVSGRIVIESTARGEGNIFHRLYVGAKRGENEFKSHYYRWFEHEEYRLKLEEGESLELTFEERELVRKNEEWFLPIETRGLEKIKWRRQKKSRLGSLFIQEYPELTDEEAFIRSGSPVFDTVLLSNIQRDLPDRQDPFEIWLGGELYVYKMVEPGARYVVGADPSEGDVRSDYSAAVVIRSWPLPMEQVALLRGRWSPDLFSEKLWRLGTAYNKALLVVERNNHGHAVLLNLSNGIVRQGEVKYPPYENLFVGPDKKLGWLTGVNKSLMIQELDKAIRSGEILIRSLIFIEEAKKFSYLGGGKIGASPGNYDDVVMAQALALMGVMVGGFSVEFV